MTTVPLDPQQGISNIHMLNHLIYQNFQQIKQRRDNQVSEKMMRLFDAVSEIETDN